MSGQGIQSEASPMAKIQSQLECPVCLNIPRELPLPSCPSGHIVCRSCRAKVTDCPTCRQPMPANMTNSLVGAFIDQVQHSCKYKKQGCEVKMMLKDLLAHEGSCPERTIKCPYDSCGSFIKLKDINEHFLNRPALSFSPPHSSMSESDGKFHLSHNVTRNSLMFNKWPMTCVKVDDELFHVHVGYYQIHKCFALSVWSSPDGAANYRANLRTNLTDDDRAMSMTGLRITSVENVQSIDKCMEENGKYFWCIPETFTVKMLNSDGYGRAIEWLHVDFNFEENW